jgi:hypothetical protein
MANEDKYGAVRPVPPQQFTRGEVPSIEGSVKRLTGVTLPFADLSRGPGSLVSNAAVVGSSSLLSGLTAPTTYAENEIFPRNPTSQDVEVLSSPARWEPDSTGDMSLLLNRRPRALDGLRASRGGPMMPGEGA